MKKKKKTDGFARTTYDDGILTIYDKVLKTPDSFISIQNIARVSTAYYRPHFRLFFLGIAILLFGIIRYNNSYDHYYESYDDNAWIYLVVAGAAFALLTYFAFRKLYALHIDISSGSRVTFTSHAPEFTRNVAAVIGEIMRDSDSLRAPMTVNFQTTSTTLVDASTYNQNYGANYGSMGNAANYSYGTTGTTYGQTQQGQYTQYGQNVQYGQQAQYGQRQGYSQNNQSGGYYG